MKINIIKCPYPVGRALIKIMEKEIAKTDIPDGVAVTLNFRDPDYSAESGGYHPVEIRLEADGTISYVTDFSIVGLPPYSELAKEIDFDFGQKVFQHFDRTYPLEAGAELWGVWCSNFCSYYQMEIYAVTVTPD